MNYMTVSEAAQLWGISPRRVRTLCEEGKVDGLSTDGNRYLIPRGAAKPIDGRTVRHIKTRRIRDILNEDGLSLSFEVFPPKQSAAFASVKEATEQITALRPSFMSVTYGAAGTTVGYTESIAANITKSFGVPTVAHLTCVASKRESVREFLTHLRADGVENILALRGDLPQSGERCRDFLFAKDLVEEIRAFGGFSIGCACYPEGHPESPSQAKDIEYLKEKVEAGCDFMTSQMFFDNDIFYNFAFKVRDAGIGVPIIPGIMPIISASSIKRTCAISGTSLPPRFARIVDRFGDDNEAMREAGIAYATEQIIDLFANGVRAVHVYSMNRPEVAKQIMNNLSHILGRSR